MKYIKAFTVGSTLFICSLSFGQNEIKKIKITEASIQFGPFTERNASGSINDFRMIAPESVLLGNDFSLYNSYSGFKASGTTTFTGSVGLQFANKEKSAYRPTPLLRIGLNYISSSSIAGNARKEDYFAYDTLTSSQNGSQILVDSVRHNEYYMDYRSDQLRLNASLLFRTNPAARWSVYGGIGVSFGVSINAQTDILYRSHSELRAQNYTYMNPYYSGTQPPYFTNPFLGEDQKTESIRGKNNIGYAANIPLGVDFRIGNKRDFWKMMHLFCEVRPGVNFISIPDARTFSSVYVQHNIGVKVSWQ